MHNNIRFEISLRGGKRELKKRNLSIINAGRSTSIMRSFLIRENKTINHLRVINSAAKLHLHINVLKISISGGLLIRQDLHYCVNSDRSQQIRVVRHDLRRERCNSVLNQLLAVFEVNRDRHIIDYFECFFERNLETIGNLGGVETFLEELLRCSE